MPGVPGSTSMPSSIAGTAEKAFRPEVEADVEHQAERGPGRVADRGGLAAAVGDRRLDRFEAHPGYSFTAPVSEAT